MDGRLFGNLIHAVLNRFGESDLIHATGVGPIERSLIDFLHQEAKQELRYQTVGDRCGSITDGGRTFASVRQMAGSTNLGRLGDSVCGAAVRIRVSATHLGDR